MRLALGLGLPYGGEAGVGVPGGSPASKALIDETDGLALSFVDDYFLSSTGHYGSARVKDTSTPANNYNSHPFGLLTYSGASPKLCRGPDGNLRYGAHNLVLQSEDFTNAAWNKLRVSASASGFITEDTNSNEHAVQTSGFSLVSGLTYAFSIEGKADTRRYLYFRTGATGSNVNHVLFDLQDGQIVSEGSSHIDASIVDMGDGYYKCTVELRAVTSSSFINWGMSNTNTINHTPGVAGPSYTGDGSSGFFLRKAHYRRTPSDSTYLRTTSAAAYELPYEWDENGDLLGIRVEGQRTNLFLNNREPETQDITVTAQAYTLSFYGPGSITLSGAHSDTLNGTGVNDRVTLTFTPEAGTLTCTVDGDIDFVQLEAGAFATSPIVTAGSTVTRAADNISLAASKFPDITTEVTVYSEHIQHVTQSGGAFAWCLDETNDLDVIAPDSGSRLQARVAGVGTTLESPITTGLKRVAFAAKSGDYAACLNGGDIVFPTGTTVPANAATLYIGSRNGTNYLNGHVKSIMLVPRRATNLEVQTLFGNATFSGFNGIWSQYIQPRGIVVGGVDHVGAVQSDGDLVVITETDVAPLKTSFQVDDHAHPAFLRRSSDDRIIIQYCRHNDTGFYQRISANPDDLSELGSEVDLDGQFEATQYSYPNPVEVEDGIITFFRAATGGEDFTMHYSVSTDEGETWSQAVRLLTGLRPYFKVFKSGPNRVDICCNDSHPASFDGNSTYHFYYDMGTWRDSAGNDLGSPPFTPSTDLTQVYDGSTDESWVWDIAWDAANAVPVIVFATFPTPESDHRYKYAKWNGASWDVNEICTAGGPLYSAQRYYSGGICIDPDDVNTIYCSREDGNGVYQIWRGVTADDGQTWTMTQLTFESEEWCIRPNKLAGSSKIQFNQGRYTAYTDYETVVKWLDV